VTAIRAFFRRHRLTRDLSIVLAIKALLLCAGFWFFFGPDKRLEVTPASIESHLMPPAKGARP
jgi:hypothetical protein